MGGSANFKTKHKEPFTPEYPAPSVISKKTVSMQDYLERRRGVRVESGGAPEEVIVIRLRLHNLAKGNGKTFLLLSIPRRWWWAERKGTFRWDQE